MKTVYNQSGQSNLVSLLKCLLLNKISNCFLLNKSLAKNLSEHIGFTNRNTGGSTGPFMTSYLPFTYKRESCLYAFSVNTHI